MKHIQSYKIRNERYMKGLAAHIANILMITALFALTSQLAVAQATRTPTPGATDLSDFREVDGDRMKVLRKGGTIGKIRIKLEADNPWWKMLRVFDGTGSVHDLEQQEGRYWMYKGLYVPLVDSFGTVAKREYQKDKTLIEIDSRLMTGRFRLEFWKAKFLGAHTHVMTKIFSKQDFDGLTVIFTWRDGLKDEDSDSDLNARIPINESLTIDGKNVKIASSGGGKIGFATIKFSTDIPWWTAIKTFYRSGSANGIEKVNGAYEPNNRTLELPIDSLPSEVKLEFWTAKLLGVHTHMATKEFIRDRFDGRIVTVTWGSASETTTKAPPSTPAATIKETLNIDGKRVTIRSVDNGTNGYVKFVFQTDKDWWTALRFADRSGKARLIEKVNGSYRPTNRTLTLPISSLPANTKLEFWTAKAFGVHTYMASQAFARERLDGRTITINWPK